MVFHHAISLALGVVIFYSGISLASVKLGIINNTEVTQNSPRANWLLLHLSNYTFSCCNFNASKSLPTTSLFVGANRLVTTTHSKLNTTYADSSHIKASRHIAFKIRESNK